MQATNSLHKNTDGVDNATYTNPYQCAKCGWMLVDHINYFGNLFQPGIGIKQPIYLFIYA